MPKLYQICLFLVFNFFQISSLISCPYEGKTLIVSKSLTECLFEQKSRPLMLVQIMKCFASLVPSGQTNLKSVYFENYDFSTRYQGLPKENYKPCEIEFNKLLDAIMIERAEIEKEEELIRNDAQKRKLRTKTEIIEEALKYQDDICQGKILYFTAEKDVKIELFELKFRETPFKMYVYKENDIVSSQIKKYHTWEANHLQTIGSILEKYQNMNKITDKSKITFLDIGAQIGWYSMNIAAKGYKVVSFEPMSENEYLVRKNICANPNFNILYINKALGEEEKTCYLYSENKNKGDPGLFCNEGGPNNPAYFNRGAVDVFKLDDFAEILENVIAIKMDIEGYEYNVIRGGRKVIFEKHVPYILSEFSPEMLKQKGCDPHEYIMEFVNHGYKVSRDNFEIGFLNEQQIDYIDKIPGIQDIYFTYKSAKS